MTLHTFLKGFFSISDTTPGVKARATIRVRASAIQLLVRLPFVRKYATFYVDSIAHDDVTPISAPRRAAYRTGLYLSQFPKLHKLDLRVEAVTTDPGVSRSLGGQFNYYEIIQRQGYTNKGFIMGDWIGREAKGGQAWLTYHLSGNECVQVEYLNKKNAKDFVSSGTTQNSFQGQVVKRICTQLEAERVGPVRALEGAYLQGRAAEQYDGCGAVDVLSEAAYPRSEVIFGCFATDFARKKHGLDGNGT